MRAPYELLEISREELQALANKPIADSENGRAGKIWLPLGKRPKPRAQKPIYEGDFLAPVSKKEAKELVQKNKDRKLASVLNYYASTSVPFDRIADHTNLPVERVAELMKARGRVA